MRYAAVLVAACVAALAVTLAVSSQAQDKQPDTKQPDPIVVKGTLPAHWKQLGLDEKQRTQIYQIEADYKVKTDALKKQMDDLKVEQKAKMYGVLTDGQKARLKEIESKGTKDSEPTKDKAPAKDK